MDIVERQLLVDEVANELRAYRHSKMASAALAEHLLAIPRIHDAQATIESLQAEVERKDAALQKIANMEAFGFYGSFRKPCVEIARQALAAKGETPGWFQDEEMRRHSQEVSSKGPHQ